ncbi:hypothetical protein BCR37DRAFT_393911 [Protomyces lactucae-debilis]|uniref:CNH domain-containing protein n=1 Tax=Protomyces lactucae-debilis TaxID=2754530 RepID=A0A1Y2F7F8_PROLT|nr:uncharacterized protein BCR37DRAFT_393911 [Protomyces lactucae-debilis]ORY79828.1 hypothetical protein BCR37DRAFT_393911 [Protomyces lactucae-debilis]
MDRCYLLQQQQLLADGVTALDADDSNVFLGTESGQLLRFVIHREDPDSEADSFTYLLASQQDSIENAPVKSILLLAHIQLVAVLANDVLSFYTLPEFAPASHLRIIKDVQGVIWGSSLDVEISEEAYASLTVFTKRKVRQLLITSDRVKLAREVEYAGCIAACQRGSIVCAATKHSYDLLDLQEKARIQLFPVVQGEAEPEGPQFDKFMPRILSPSASEFLVTSGSPEMPSALGMFVTMEGDITRGTLMFDDYPLSLICVNEKILALMPSQKIEVHNIMNQLKELTIEVPGMTSIFTTSEDVDVVVKENLKLISLVNLEENEKWTSSLDIARRASVATTRIVLCGSGSVSFLPSATELMHLDEILGNGGLEQCIKRAAAFYKKRPEEEAYHCQAYVHQKAGLLYFNQLLFDDALDHLLAGDLDPRILLSLFRTLPQSDTSTQLKLYKGVRKQLSAMQPIEQTIRSTLESTVDDPATVTELCTILEGQAIEMCRRFLTKYRTKRQTSKLVSDVLGPVEAALLHILLSMDRGEAKPKLQEFFQLELANIEQSIRYLQQHYRWWELLQLLTRLARHEEALSIWQQLMEGTISDQDYPGQGFRAMKDYLIQHGTDDLIWRFGIWLLQMYTDIGVELFDTVDASPNSATTYTSLLDKLRTGDDRGIFLKVLNHVVASSPNVSIALSNELILTLAEQVTSKLSNSSLSNLATETVANYRQMRAPKMPFPMFVLENRLSGSGEVRQFAELRARLIDRLQDDAQYDAQAVLDVILQNKDILLAERIILYGRLGKHAEALKILVRDLKDFDSAEVYCYHGGVSLSSLRIGTQKLEILEMRHTLFPMLLQECLNLPDVELRYSQGVALLNRWSSYMKFDDVLTLIPDEWSIEAIASFLQVSLSHLAAEKRDVQIQRSLVRLQARRQTQSKLIRLQ